MKTTKTMLALGAAAIAMSAAPASAEFGRKDAGNGPADEVTPAELKQLTADVKGALAQVQDFATKAAESLRKGEEMFTPEQKTKIDEALTKLNGLEALSAQVTALEQKAARGGGQPELPKSPGNKFVEDEQVKAFLASVSGGKRVGVDVKAIITSLTTNADGSAGDLLVPQRLPIIDPVERKLTVRDLLTPGRTNAMSIQYPKETGFTNSAAVASESDGSAKPQSELKFDLVTETVVTIAHWVLAHRNILADAPMLASYIDGRMRYGLAYVEDNALLNGAGGADLNGIYTQATASTANLAVIATPTFLDVLRAAMLQASLANIPPTGIVLNPTDWFKIETTKDTAGAYIIGNPQDGTNRRLWGLPVVETPAMTVDKFLVGAFKYGAQIFDREDARVEVSTEDSDNFRKNLVTILAEERLALAVYNTLAFVKGDFSDQVTDLTS
jgi:HK97 family phage major capsid protein